jgi:hypothetical protein
MNTHHRINLRAHLAKRGVFRPGALTPSQSEFLAYRCTGRSTKALVQSPFQLSRRQVGI